LGHQPPRSPFLDDIESHSRSRSTILTNIFAAYSATMILLSKTATGVANGIVMLKMVLETPLQFGVAERLSRTFRAESTRIRVEAPKMLWADSVSTTYLLYRIPYVLIGLRILEEEWRGKDTSLAHLKVQKIKNEAKTWSDGGPRWPATVDRRWPPPPLTTVDRWSDGGSGDGTGDSWHVTWHHPGGDTWSSNDWYKVSGLGMRLQVRLAARLVWWLARDTRTNNESSGSTRGMQ
ncbi:hypothetical protein Tco_1477649, partial [Tanacetum coccineum]